MWEIGREMQSVDGCETEGCVEEGERGGEEGEVSQFNGRKAQGCERLR